MGTNGDLNTWYELCVSKLDRYSSIVLNKKKIKEYRDKNNTRENPEIQIKTTREKQVETCH